MSVTHEEKPKSQANKRVPENEMELIIVQVTPNDIAEGDDKAARLMGEGWEQLPSMEKGTPYYTGMEGRFYMQKPKKQVQGDRKQRFDQWQSLMHQPVAQAVPSGSIKSVELEDDLNAEDFKAMNALQALKAHANG